MNAPDHLDDEARTKWSELWPILQARGDVDQGTRDALSVYCLAWSQWKQAQAKVAELGTVVKSPAGFAIVSPYVQIAAQAERRLRQWSAELKLTPKTRGRKQNTPEPAGDGLDGLLGRLKATRN